MVKPVLRQLEASDIAAVAKLELLCNPMPWNSEALTRFATDDSGVSGPDSVGRVAVLENSGEVVGYVCAAVVGDEAEIMVVGVDLTHRKQGMGWGLLNELRRALRIRGCKSLFLEVRSGNEAALSLYRKAGFVQTGSRKGYYADTGEDALLLRWDLAG